MKRSRHPHYQVHVRADQTSYGVAVNVKSQMSPSELLFLIDERFRHPVTAALPGLPQGFTERRREPGGLALDFIRGNLLDRMQLQPLAPNLHCQNNDLSDRVEHYVARARREHGSEVYALGERWGQEQDKQDMIFGFLPDNGVHNIHMNQGNHLQFARDDGVWPDGTLVFTSLRPSNGLRSSSRSRRRSGTPTTAPAMPSRNQDLRLARPSPIALCGSWGYW